MTATGTALFDISEADSKLWNGGWTEAPESLDVIEPATGDSLGRVGAGGTAEVLGAATDAAQAQREWAATDPSERAEILRRAADILQEHHEEAETWLVREAGAVRARAEFEVNLLAIGELREAAELHHSQDFHFEVPDPRGIKSVARRVPVGVVGVIAPWNFPMVLSTRSVAPALALGNAVVLKADPNTPVTGGLFLARVLSDAGLPAGLFHVVPGGAEKTRERMVSLAGWSCGPAPSWAWPPGRWPRWSPSG